MSDLYAVLGVSKTASHAEIKSAYKKLAQRLHPDRPDGTGDKEKAQVVNEAYSILGNKRRRALYDETGQVREGNPRTQAIQGIVSLFWQLFDQIPENENIVQLLRLNIKKNQREIENQIGQEKAKIKRLTKTRDRVQAAHGVDNFIQLGIDQRIQEINKGIEQRKHHLMIGDLGLEILSDYRFEHELSDLTAAGMNIYGGTSSTTTF